MYENYLLNPSAIATITSSIEGFREYPVTPEEVERWLARRRCDKRYIKIRVDQAELNEETWVRNVHGARLLEDIFKEFSENRVIFDKVDHGVELTNWIIENAPADLKEVTELIKQVLQRKRIEEQLDQGGFDSLSTLRRSSNT